MAEEPIEAPVAPTPEAEPELRAVTLLDTALVLGELKPQGKVMRLPADEADRLLRIGAARDATPLDLKVAGLVE